MSLASVLVVEDDPVFQSVIQRYLAQLGYHVTCASTGQEGLACYQSHVPDIILCDLKLPDISGLQVIETVLEQGGQSPVIVISASESIADIRQAVSLGAWDYLVKPINNLAAINDAIEHCLQRYQLEDSYETDLWELDNHIQVLYQDDLLVQRLTEELLPENTQVVQGFRLQFSADEHSPKVWLDAKPLMDNKVLVIMASPQNATEQTLIPLLVLKTLFDPLLRQYLTHHDQQILAPERLLAHLNRELCRSKIRAAFDVLVGILDCDSREWCWGQAGDRIRSYPQGRPDLALGIWRNAQFHKNYCSNISRVEAQLSDVAQFKIVPDLSQTA